MTLELDTQKEKTSKQKPLNIEVGKTFLPFDGVTSFLPNTIRPDDFAPVIETHITFQGKNGKLVALANDGFDFENFETPLGDVHVLKVLHDDEVSFRETPVTLVLHFNVKSLEEFDELTDYKAQFNLNGKVYDLDLVESGERVEAKNQLKEDDEALVSADDLTLNGESHWVLLPMDLSLLSGIEVTFVRK